MDSDLYFFLQDLLTILPMIDSLVLIDIKGAQIHQALENGVSQWPKLDGRFPQVGGITFAFDPTKAPGSRIDPAYIKIGTEYMDSQTHYKLATKAGLTPEQMALVQDEVNQYPSLDLWLSVVGTSPQSAKCIQSKVEYRGAR